MPCGAPEELYRIVGDQGDNIQILGEALHHIFGGSGAVSHKSGKDPIFPVDAPNIIICTSEKALLYQVIAIYQGKMGRSPHPGEFLFCNDSTPAEDIELFFRRCVQAPKFGSFLFCLANLQEMNFRQQEQTVELYRKLCMGHTGYVLVMLTVKVQHGQQILSAFTSHTTTQEEHPSATHLKRLLYGSSAVVYRSTVVGTGKSRAIFLNKQEGVDFISIPINGPISSDSFIAVLQGAAAKGRTPERNFHFNLASTVDIRINLLLYQLVVGRTLCHSDGSVFHRRPGDKFYIEIPNSIGNRVDSLLYFCVLLPHQLINVTPTDFDLTLPDVQRVCKWLQAYQERKLLVTIKSGPGDARDDVYDWEKSKWLIDEGPNLNTNLCIQLLQEQAHVLTNAKQSFIATSNFVKFFKVQLDNITSSQVCFYYAQYVLLLIDIRCSRNWLEGSLEIQNL